MILALISHAVFFLTSIWLGEAGRFFVSDLVPLALMLPIAILIGRLIRKQKVINWGYLGCSIFVLGIGYNLGSWSFQHAYHECLTTGEQVRSELASYYENHGHYPALLNEITSTPGGRLLRGRLLQYKAQPESYTLSFSDWLVTHRASNIDPFLATK